MKRLPLTQGKYAIVDDEDFNWLSQWKWCYAFTKPLSYALRGERIGGVSTTKYLHREIMKPEKGMDVDHRNHDTLDNRKANLRICSRSSNLRNKRKTNRPCSSRYKGVSWDKQHCKWSAEIFVRGTRFRLGRFDDQVDAATFYDVAAQLFSGEFASLNNV